MMVTIGLNQIKHLIFPLYGDFHFSVSFSRNMETSVMYSPIWGLPSSTLVHRNTLLLASLHLRTMGPEITTIPTRHINVDAHLL